MRWTLPKYVQNYLVKMSILMLIFSLCRVFFYWRNSAYFPDVSFLDFLVGCWFDLITTSLLFLPLVALELFPLKDRSGKWYKRSITILSLLLIGFGLFINLVDIEYFAFSSSRANSSLFIMLSFGDDLLNQLPSYLAEFWYWIILFFGVMIGLFFWIKKLHHRIKTGVELSLVKQTILYIFFLGLTLFFARGGWVSKPIRPTEASKYTSPANSQLVLNSAFTVLNSIQATPLKEKSYFKDHRELHQWYSPIQHYSSEGQIKGQNVVIIILESFAIEYINSLNPDDISLTPFFDELVDSSLVFNWAFANGKKSLDAVPSILASVPKMMEDEYLLSPYANNTLHSLPEILGNQGYQTAFFHGATNGSMNFDAFCSHIGFDHYFGRDEYGNDEDFDGTWGIYDEEFMLWSIQQMNQMKTPFFSTIFTVTSHPPYTIPDRYKDQFKEGKNEQEKAVQYTDWALRQFFESASKQSWFDHTLFILTADHTPSSNRKIYVHDRGKLHVPLLMYHPTDTFFQGRNDSIIGHIDVMPSILDLMGYDQPFFAFGHSVFDSLRSYTFSQIAGKFYLMEYDRVNPHLLIFQRGKAVALFHFLDVYQRQNLINDKPKVVERMENRIKAIIQTYNHQLIHNEMTVESYLP